MKLKAFIKKMGIFLLLALTTYSDAPTVKDGQWDSSPTAPMNARVFHEDNGDAAKIEWYKEAQSNTIFRIIGQSFKLASVENLEAITVKLREPLQLDASRHIFQVAVLQGISSTQIGNTVLGAIGEYNLANANMKAGDYLTFTLPESIPINPSTLYHFEMGWAYEYPLHKLHIERNNEGEANGCYYSGHFYNYEKEPTFPAGSNLSIFTKRDLTFCLKTESSKKGVPNTALFPQIIPPKPVPKNPTKETKISIPGTTTAHPPLPIQSIEAPEKLFSPLKLSGLIPAILLLLLIRTKP